MADTVGDFLRRRLQRWGVSRVFGYAGDGISGLHDALARMAGAPGFALARHGAEGRRRGPKSGAAPRRLFLTRRGRSCRD